MLSLGGPLGPMFKGGGARKPWCPVPHGTLFGFVLLLRGGAGRTPSLLSDLR